MEQYRSVLKGGINPESDEFILSRWKQSLTLSYMPSRFFPPPRRLFNRIVRKMHWKVEILRPNIYYRIGTAVTKRESTNGKNNIDMFI